MPSECGQSLVEFALAAALLLLTTFGAIAGGLSIYRYNMTASLAQQGARWAAISGSSSAGGIRAKYGTRALLESELRKQNRSLPITVAVKDADNNDVAPEDLDPGDTATVRVTTTWLPVGGVPLPAFNMTSYAVLTVVR